MKIASTLVLSLPLLASSILTGSCQQGEGEFCQVTVDCEDGLECNAATQRCQKPGTANTTPDAAPVVIPDAATVVDAGVDASAPDATAFDASQPDGAPTS